MIEHRSLSDLLMDVPVVIAELADEFLLRLEAARNVNPKSQESACFMLALRCTSLSVGMGALLHPRTSDSFEALSRAFLETRDLLSDFRFPHAGTLEKIERWFTGKYDATWKANHTKIEEHIDKYAGGKSELAARWSMFSALSHPTVYAATNSVVCVANWGQPSQETLPNQRIADYLAGIQSLIVVATIDLPDWLPLEVNPAKIPRADPFVQQVAQVAMPILAATRHQTLPDGSYKK